MPPASPDNVPELESLLTSGYRYALSLAHEPALAEDLLQEGCLAITRQGGPWEKPYLFRIIRNRYIDAYRRSKVVPFEPLVESGDHASNPFHYPHGDAIRLLQLLEPEDRELLYLNVIEGWSARELAEHTGSKRNTILSRLHRAKARLRDKLASEAPETNPASPASPPPTSSERATS